MSMPRYASLDVGSNTVRLLLAEKGERGKIQPLRVERHVTRLGGNFSKEGNLDEAAMERTLGTLAVFADLLKEEGVRTPFAVATGVLREAKNGKAFIQRVFERTGLSLRLVSGEEEGCLMLKGVLGSLVDKIPTRMVADVGGWSTEILWVEGDEPKRVRSVPLGVVPLAEKFLRNDPPLPEELEVLELSVRGVLGKIREGFEGEGLPFEDLHPHLLGTAGTMTTLAAIDRGLQVYDPQKISGHRITRPDLEKIYLSLRSLPLRERRNVPGLEKGREDLIVAGAVVVLSLLEAFDLKTLLVVDSGLLEGVLLDGISRIP
jgi:exopolyphosphatase/guanosine-5'-triphosphate,3'-diphosphate pyrophosphatase